MAIHNASRPDIDTIVQRVAEHAFYPIDNGFTVDPETGYDGVSDRTNLDWRVRTLALRDLVCLGRHDTTAIEPTLAHDDPHLRQVGAQALGILGADGAVEPLERLLREDSDEVARSHAAIALGQIARPSDAVETQVEADPSADVRHQCVLARDRIAKGASVEPEVAARFAELDETTFQRVREGEPAPDFTLEDTEGRSWHLGDLQGEGERTVVLLWIFADWCPVCHREFHELIANEDRFRDQGIAVATLECHDRFRGRVMVGKEGEPDYWFADSFPDGAPLAPYPSGIWWPHLIDRAASVGVQCGIDPWQFTVHSEWVNRPSTVIIDPEGTVRLAYAGRFWGDRPSIEQVLTMIETGHYEFERPPLRRAPH